MNDRSANESLGCIAICLAVLTLIGLAFFVREFGGDIGRWFNGTSPGRWLNDGEPWWSKVGGVLIWIAGAAVVSAAIGAIERARRK